MKKTVTSVIKLGLICASLGLFNNLQAQRNQVLSTKIAQDSDDAEERGTNASSNAGLMDLTSSDIELVEDGGDGNQFVGLRFASVNLPKNAIIDSAFIQFTVDETNSGATSVVIQAEDVDSSSTFTSSQFNISSRTNTTASVNWNNIPAWGTVAAATMDQRTPDVSSLVSAIMNRPGWNQGNPITFLITGTGERTAEAHNGTGAQAAELIVHYSVPTQTTFSILTGSDDAEQSLANNAMDLTSSDLEITTENSDQLIGLRFDGLNIPAGATILDAYLQFQVDESTTSGTVNVAIVVENSVNPSTFSSLPNDIGGRNYSNVAPVLWDSIAPWGTVGQSGLDQRSPSVASLVQDRVNQPNWAAGNAIVFGLVQPAVISIPGYTANTGKRTAESLNGSAAPQLVVEYLEPTTYQNVNFPIAKFSSWKYNDEGIDLGTAWAANSYNDSSWAFGDAVLGYSNPHTTTLDFGTDANNKHITTYLRHTFNGANAMQYDSLIFDVLRDDGVIVYINGVEAFRSNMPTGTVNFNTTAIAPVGGSDETTYYRFTVDNTLLPGVNTIAVELHQANATSSDLSFDMEVTGKLPPMSISNFPVRSGDEWNFLDDGSDLTSTAWKTLNYNDTTWNYGPSALGYNNANTNTVVSFGPDANDKYITTYFRKRVNIANLTSLGDSLILNLRRDDGAVVYVNGTEVVRSNMPAGAINHLTTSSTIVSGADEDRFFSTTVNKNIFTQGINIIAVELHQRDSSSSDLTFDFEILEKPNARRACNGPNDPHISCYTSLFPTGQDPDLWIPETHAFQVLLEQGDSYTNQLVRTTAPGNNDFTGYVPRNGSSVDGFLAVNHENTPGGVSILDIRYNDSTRLWTVDSSQAVDFYNNDLVSTTRNCSGGITPWGTIITSEETRNSGDVNNDGYQDVGWQVEIDPVTRKVKEYGTPGKQEKLWALGRMSHENIAVANDSITAYEGEDSGSGCLYKFVANTPMDLSSGKLYALQLTGGLTGGEPNSSVGKWIEIPNTTITDRNETRNLALTLGATPFNGIEDAEIGTVDGKIYFTSKGHNRVYRFNDDTDSTISGFETFVGGPTSYLINYGNGVVAEDWGRGNDNLCFDDLGNLYVLQDGSRNHIWMVGPNHTQAAPKVDLFAKLPAGSEPCGMTFTPDYQFAFVSVQHPSGGNSSTTQIDASGYGATMAQSTTVVIARKELLGSYAPTMAASNFTFPTASCDTIDLAFNTGNGNGRLVVAKEAAMVDAAPRDGFTYTANNTLGSGSVLGANNFVIYDGADSSVTIKGLKQNTMYHVSVFEYNQSPNKYYNTVMPLIDSTSTAAVNTSAITGVTNTVVNATETYSVTNTSGSTYAWNVTNGTIIAGAGTNSITVNWGSTIGTGTISVTETNAASCVGDSVVQSINIGTTGIQNFDLAHAMTIAPNPSNGRTTVSLIGNNDAYDVEVLDLVGKQISVATNQTGSYEIDLSSEKKGTYVIRVRSQNKVGTKLYIKN
jgi:secreted PhoX family phosphatase